MNDDGHLAPLTPETLRRAHPRQRVDLLRTTLRTRPLSPDAIRAQFDDWIALFHETSDPALLVLLLELFDEIEDERVLEVARSALGHRGDGVRLEALRLVLDRHPERIERLARDHRRDRSLEVQLLLAMRWFAVEPGPATNFLFEIFEAECGGPREGHALERGVEFLVDEAATPAVIERLRRIQPDFDDPEGFIAWGIHEMERRLT